MFGFCMGSARDPRNDAFKARRFEPTIIVRLLSVSAAPLVAVLRLPHRDFGERSRILVAKGLIA